MEYKLQPKAHVVNAERDADGIIRVVDHICIRCGRKVDQDTPPCMHSEGNEVAA